MSIKMTALSGGAALPEFVSSSINSLNGTSITVTAPSGIQNGDLLVAVVVRSNTSGFTITPPTGFNAQCFENTADNTLVIASKVAASESGNYTFTWSGTATDTAAAILVYRNATQVNTVGSKASSGSASAITASSITPTFRGVLVGAFATPTVSRTVTSAPSGMTQRAFVNANATLAVYDQSPQEASASGSKAITFSGAANIAGILLQITNEPTVAPEFVASASTSTGGNVGTLVINKPTGTVEGDLMVAVMSKAVDATWTGDTGWTEVADQGLNPSLRVAYKVAGASEGGSYTFTANTSSNGVSGSILTYRYAAYDTIGSFVTGANPLVLSSISPSESQSVLIAAGARGTVSTTLGTPTSMTAQVTDSDADAPSYIVCDQIVAKGPTGTRSMSTGGSSTSVAGIMLSIKPTRSL